MSVFNDEITTVEKLIVKEKVPTKNPRGLATIMYLTASWACNDALAGLQLENVLRKESAQKSLKLLVNRILDIEIKRVNKVTLLRVLQELAKRHKVFDALKDLAIHGGKSKKLFELEELYEKMEEETC